MLFRNATIYTMEQDPFVGDFKIDKGVFTQIGKDLTADVLKLQIIVATHSVDFVNGNWGDCFDLFEGMKKNVNEL